MQNSQVLSSGVIGVADRMFADGTIVNSIQVKKINIPYGVY